ncbi:MAG: FecR domain-containing protein [Spirochaetia bacterium]|nr:FecR domain-containing protein [Spirochaetia bacterium]
MKKSAKLFSILFIAFSTLVVVNCKDKSKNASEIHGTITFIRGSVLLNQTPVQIGAKVSMSDSIEVKDKSTAVVQFSTNAMITIESNSSLVIKSLLQGKDGVPTIAMDQSRGSTFNKIVPGKANYSVNTPTITAGVRGTSFRVTSGTDTHIELYTGKVALIKDDATVKDGDAAKGKTEELILEAGQKVTVTETEIQAPVKMSATELKDLERMNDIAMLPEKKLNKVEKIETVSVGEAKKIEEEMAIEVVPEESQRIIVKMEVLSAPEVTLDDIKKQYGSLSKVTTKNGKSYTGAFKQVGGKFEIITVTGKEVITATDIAKVQPLE